MQVTAGVQGNGRVLGAERDVGHHILQAMGHGQAVVFAQGLAGGDQCGVIFQAGQVLPGLQQAAAEVALAGAPIQPVCRRCGKSQRRAEGFDLLPFAPGHIDIQAMAGGLKGHGR